jgi:hypothetical protein
MFPSRNPSAAVRAFRRLAQAMAVGLMIAGLATASVQAQDRPVGQIDTVRGVVRPGDAVITRATGGDVPARALMRLHVGDRISVTGTNARLTLFLGGAVSPTTVTRANSPFLVEGPRSGPAGAFARRMLASLDLVFDRPRMAIATATEARGINDDLAPVPFLPAVPQILPDGVRPVLVLWSGPASPVQIVHDSQTREWASSGYTSLVVEAPQGGDFRIVMPDTALGWAVTRVAAGAAPRAPETPTGTDLSSEERLANALWILTEAGPEWRLFALSEIASLADEDYGAARLLAAIRAGEIEPEDLRVGG